MTSEVTSPLERIFKTVLAGRFVVLAVSALLLSLAVWRALKVPHDNAIDRFIVETDPDYVATAAFHKIFPEAQNLVLTAEAADPFAPGPLRAFADLEALVKQIPGLHTYSALSLWATNRGPLDDSTEQASAFKVFALGTKLFRRQGLVGDGSLGIAVALTVADAEERDRALAAIEEVVARTLEGGAITRVRKVGRAYVDAWVEAETHRSTLLYLPLFGVFAILLTFFLYRSVRALAAILGTVGATVGLTVGWGEVVGYSFTIISTMVPLTILVTATATLVYLHSRFVDRPDEVPPDRHQVFALANKFVPVTASLVAAMLGFAALGVSQLRPIREMGLWLAVGLGITWVTSFALFPALQRLCRAPSGPSVAGWQKPGPLGRAYARVTDALPIWSYRWRWWLVPGSLAICGVGTVAIFGLPGAVEPMPLGVEAIDYLDRDLPLYQDAKHFQQSGSGLSVARVWVTTPPGAATDSEVLRGLAALSTRIQELPDVALSLGPTGVLNLRRYISGQGDTLPDDPDAFAEATADFEQLLMTRPELRTFVDVDTLSNAQIMVLAQKGDGESFERLRQGIGRAWEDTLSTHPALAGASHQIVGASVLQAKIGANLVPTLTESFALTAGCIFLTFLVVFRSGAARLMAMIPSFFAILATFIMMRLTGIPLNVATILVATTVLGTSENDQVHFFYHFQEGRRGGSTEQAMRHTFRVSGRAIAYATLINAGGFLALALSNLPPMRQFGIITCWAFLFSMIADFTALPAALWIFFREKPDAAGQPVPVPSKE
jgi:predicted RND superfamily exporter protein